MSVSSEHVNNGKECLIRIGDKLVYRLYREFRQAYTDCDPATELITVDLQNTRYIDSSALGMMLLLKKHARDNQRQIRLINVSDTILRAFEIVQLDTEFEISATTKKRQHAT
ncbi:STAS domain-containing protein [Thiohalophilus sp.]|uniref:STAS domain-containing protein n=1 Tax=Thiohalophilus sp. TaxID=3028392 RepID=UPI002ACEA895|nr:STAS domain-containing protein [Thiohalophilus sp.]MDZ7805180.1 STAS domain-containing protein [Thiohalophilus sp.]